MTLAPASRNARTTPWQAFVHLLKGYVGPGCLSLPWAISQMGVEFGVTVVLVVAYWTSYNIWQLLLLKREYCKEQRRLLWQRRYGGIEHGRQPSATAIDGATLHDAISLNSTVSTRDAALATGAAVSAPDTVHNANGSHAQTTIDTNVTYSDLSDWLYGPRMRHWTTVSICVQQFAICTVFMSFVGENLGAALKEHFGRIPHTTVITMALPGAMVLSCLPNLKVLAPVMTLATVTLFAGFSVLGYLVWQAWSKEHSQHDSVNAVDEVGYTEYVQPTLNWSMLPLAVCAVLYSFEGVCLILPIEASMQEEEDTVDVDGNPLLSDDDDDNNNNNNSSSRPSSKRHKSFGLVFVLAMTASAVIYALVASLCVIAFGAISSGSITAFLVKQANENENASAEKLRLINIANTLCSVAVLLTYPLQLFPSYELVGPKWNKYVMQQLPSAICGLFRLRRRHRHVAVPGHDDDDPVRRLDSTDSSSGSSSRIEDGDDDDEDDVRFRSYQRTISLPPVRHEIQYNSNGNANNVTAATNAGTTTTPYANADAMIHDEPSPWEFAAPGDSPLMRAALVLLTYVLAIAVPNVQLLVSLAGALSGSATALILPPLLRWAYYRKKHGDRVSIIQRIEAFLLIVMGVIVMLIGTGAALADIVRTYIGLE